MEASSPICLTNLSTQLPEQSEPSRTQPSTKSHTDHKQSGLPDGVPVPEAAPTALQDRKRPYRFSGGDEPIPPADPQLRQRQTRSSRRWRFPTHTERSIYHLSTLVISTAPCRVGQREQQIWLPRESQGVVQSINSSLCLDNSTRKDQASTCILCPCDTLLYET